MSQEEVSKKIKIPLPNNLSKTEIKDIQEDIGSFLVASILDYVGEGRSPVTGSKFKAVLKPYADEEKKGDRLANLELTGDMLRSLESWIEGGDLYVGIRDDDQAPKAYNHNVGDTLPKRQFIPNGRQNFVGEIMEGIDRIVQEYASQDN